MDYIKIKSIKDLDNAIAKGIHDYIIQIGILRSSKDIRKTKDGFYQIYNYIDDAEQILSKEQLMDDNYTNIGRAMKSGSFYAEKIN